ncbi:MAG: hypothetical protein ABIX01_12735 [Chitinophagaceae bacterium]
METQSIKFIEGIFSPQEAKEILTNVINEKIHFHLLKNFSYEERYGEPIAGSQKRIAELRDSREQINLLIQQAVEDRVSLRIQSAINIAFEK